MLPNSTKDSTPATPVATSAALELVESIVRTIAHRNRLKAEEREELAAEARLALLRDDEAVLRRFQGRGSLGAYLTTVIQRLLLDRRRKLWGRWRPSAAARKLGPAAIRFELLVHRDGLAVSAALEQLRADLQELPPGQLDALTSRLRPLQRPRQMDATALDELRAPTADPGAQLVLNETTSRVNGTLRRHLAGLPAGDRLLLRLRFEDDVPVSDIARLTGGDAKRLYRKLDGLLAGLKRAFEESGLSWLVVSEVIDAGSISFCLTPSEDSESAEPGPSTSREGVC